MVSIRRTPIEPIEEILISLTEQEAKHLKRLLAAALNRCYPEDVKVGDCLYRKLSDIGICYTS